jgi:hypothetical protein
VIFSGGKLTQRLIKTKANWGLGKRNSFQTGPPSCCWVASPAAGITDASYADRITDAPYADRITDASYADRITDASYADRITEVSCAVTTVLPNGCSVAILI